MSIESTTPANPAQGEECCDLCNRRYAVTYRVPNAVWAKIAPRKETLGSHPEHQGGGLLCPDCASSEAKKIGITLRFDAGTDWQTNPAQVTDAMVEAGHNGLEEWRRLYVSKDEVRAILTAAIGSAQEEDTQSRWRDLALQFDGHRIQAMCLLRAIAADKAGKPEIEAFLSAPPLSGEQVLADRLTAIAPSGQAVAWQYEILWERGSPGDGDWVPHVAAEKPTPSPKVRNVRPLYTHPVQPGWRDMESAPGDEETPVLLWIGDQAAVGLTWKRRDGTIIGKASMFGATLAEKWCPLPAALQPKGE